MKSTTRIAACTVRCWILNWLAEVYFAMTRGQESLLGDDLAPKERLPAVFSTDASRPKLRVLQPTRKN